MITRREALLLTAGFAAGLPSSSRAETDAKLAFNELYEAETELTAKVRSMSGKRVVMQGFMAPPLKAKAKFFVLTSLPMSTCPFCETEAQWPDDIVLVLTDTTIIAAPFNRPIRVSGTLETGFAKDPGTGFVSLIRIVDAAYERL
jgi:hypothetical protein